ncbi:hypothetical protein GOP47_0013633 [Adiantum capillus-veneris]|uniref:SAP30-binding protein n=1 Tax=Adiantum capillus-veneris TaxID=13818 RepID=A0A9D4UPV3_ADICA|nr:hypothetical protein GOP47_0013633 [Adiantum capillus-veneris]
MAASKRKAEGIALLSLYNDEGDDEEDEEEDEDEENAVASLQNQQEQEIKHRDTAEKEAYVEMVTDMVSAYSSVSTVEVSVTAVETLRPTLPAVLSQEQDDLTQSPVVERPGNGAHGIFVDYAHDEGALSPDAEEGEIMSTGRAVLAVGAQINNGFVQGVTPPSLGRQENKQPESQSPQPKLEATQQSTAGIIAPDSDSMDQEMTDAEAPEREASDLDALADFLPPPPTEKCSLDLQKKFARFLAYKNAGRSFNEELRKSKGYRNPDFLQRAVKHQEIDQIGSRFSKEIFDPHGYDSSDFYDALALELKREQERKEQAKKQSQRVDFIHGGVQAAPIPALSDKTKPVLPMSTEQRDQLPSGSQGLTAASEAAPKSGDTARSNKKSKWDKVETDTKVPALMPTVAKSAIAAASAHTALLTANAGGGYASFVLQKRKEAEERSRGTERKSERK